MAGERIPSGLGEAPGLSPAPQRLDRERGMAAADLRGLLEGVRKLQELEVGAVTADQLDADRRA